MYTHQFLRRAMLAPLLLFAHGSPAQPGQAIQQAVQASSLRGVALYAAPAQAAVVVSQGLTHSVNAQTPFRIASLTKTFTAVAILQLVEKGKLRLQGTLADYLPQYRGAGARSITLHHLLTYSSGLPNCEGDSGLKVYQTLLTPAAFVQRYCSGTPQFVPGSQFSYNNADYILLGEVIRAVSGLSVEAYFRQHITNPLHMQHTGMLHHNQLPPQLAPTYSQADSGQPLQPDPFYYPEVYGAAGGMYSTAADLLRFSQALFGGNLLQPATLKLMLTPYPELYQVAYGFWVAPMQAGTRTYTAANRQGSIWGANANWLHLVETGETIIILSQTNTTDLSALAQAMLLAARSQ